MGTENLKFVNVIRPEGGMISREEDLDGDGVFDLRTGRVKE